MQPANRVVVSAPIQVLAWYDFDSFWVSVFTAGGGFLGGILTMVFTQLYQARQQRKLARDSASLESQKAVAQHLVPEILENLRLLREFLATVGSQPPTLGIGGYQSVAVDAGVLAYLSADERRAYLSHIDALYKEIKEFNLTSNLKRPADELRDRATRLIAAITEWQRISNPGNP